jgi:hypothetical protein
MRLKKYTQGVTFFITPDMLEVLKKISDEKQVSVSEVLREVLSQYLSQRVQSTVNDFHGDS